MSAHSNHPDITEHGIADNCERCAEYAENPFANYSARMLREIIEKVTNPDTRFDFRSEAEGVAFAKVMTALEHAGAMAAAAPSAVSRYLRERWG